MFGLFLLLVASGLVDRGPWAGDDLHGTALARAVHIALEHHQALGVLVPGWELGSAGQPSVLGPLLGGLLLAGLSALSQAVFAQDIGPSLWDDLLRILHGGFFGIGLWGLWQGTRRLALRREARPSDPLGIGPDAASLGRTLADCSVLLALGCVGTVLPLHSAGSFGLSIAIQGLLLWSLARAPEDPQRSGQQAGVLLGLLLLTAGIAPTLGWAAGIGFALTQLVCWRLVWRLWLLRAVAGLVLVPAVWAAAVLLLGDPLGSAALSAWTAGLIPESPFSGLWAAPKTYLWAWWPLWPLAGAAIVFSLRTRFWPDHLRLLIACLFGLVISGLVFPVGTAPRDLLPLIPLAALSAFGLMAIGPSLSGLIDWISVLLFSSLGLLVWLYWSAYQSGAPAALARRLDFFAPNLPAAVLDRPALVISMLVSLAWLGLVLWRIGRGSGPRLWRPVVLSLGGLSLSWVLLSLLWAPALQDLKGYDAMTARLHRSLDRLPGSCIQTRANDLPARRVVLALTDRAVVRNEQAGCPLLLTSKRLPRSLKQSAGATLVWSGRRSRDRSIEDRYQLYSLGIPSRVDR